LKRVIFVRVRDRKGDNFGANPFFISGDNLQADVIKDDNLRISRKPLLAGRCTVIQVLS